MAGRIEITEEELRGHLADIDRFNELDAAVKILYCSNLRAIKITFEFDPVRNEAAPDNFCNPKARTIILTDCKEQLQKVIKEKAQASLDSLGARGVRPSGF